MGADLHFFLFSGAEEVPGKEDLQVPEGAQPHQQHLEQQEQQQQHLPDDSVALKLLKPSDLKRIRGYLDGRCGDRSVDGVEEEVWM